MSSGFRIGHSWASKANCVGETAVMFSDDPLDVARAKSICEGCPARRKCLEYALDNDIDYGVWAGLDFEERTRTCPICRSRKSPDALGCNGPHTLLRLARLVELQKKGDRTISVARRGPVSAQTSPGCLVPRGRSHSTLKAYKKGCRCAAARLAMSVERHAWYEARGRERRRVASSAPLERTTEQRFMDLVEIDGAHWWWNGSMNGSGYGNFWDGKRTVRAHLFAYNAFVEPLAKSARLRSKDSNIARHCVNPACYEVKVPLNAQR